MPSAGGVSRRVAGAGTCRSPGVEQVAARFWPCPSFTTDLPVGLEVPGPSGVSMDSGNPRPAELEGPGAPPR